MSLRIISEFSEQLEREKLLTLFLCTCIEVDTSKFLYNANSYSFSYK